MAHAGFEDESDGLLDITIGALQTDLETVGAMVNLVGVRISAAPTSGEDIINFRTRRVKVTTHPPKEVVVDGEIVRTIPIEVGCIPRGQTMFAT